MTETASRFALLIKGNQKPTEHPVVEARLTTVHNSRFKDGEIKVIEVAIKTPHTNAAPLAVLLMDLGTAMLLVGRVGDLLVKEDDEIKQAMEKIGTPPFEIWVPDVPWLMGVDFGSMPDFTTVVGIGLKPPATTFDSLMAIKECAKEKICKALGLPPEVVKCICVGKPLRVRGLFIQIPDRETPEERAGRLSFEIEVKRYHLQKVLEKSIEDFDKETE